MPVINRIAAFHEDMISWRHDIHRNPETAFEEHRTAEMVARQLESFGIEVHRGLAGTGVVGTLRAGKGHRAARRHRRAAHPGEERRAARLLRAGQDACLRA